MLKMYHENNVQKFLRVFRIEEKELNERTRRAILRNTKTAPKKTS